MDWTTTEDELIIKLWNKGSTSSEIANEVGRSRNSVIGRIHRLRDMGITLSVRGRVVPKKIRPQKPKVEKPKVTKPKVVVGVTLASSLLELRPNQCRWPFETTFCDADREPGRPYCEHHRKMSFRPAPPRVRVRA